MGFDLLLDVLRKVKTHSLYGEMKISRVGRITIVKSSKLGRSESCNTKLDV